jgi:flavin-binding protein dodecin
VPATIRGRPVVVGADGRLLERLAPALAPITGRDGETCNSDPSIEAANRGGDEMSDSVYRVTEVIGVSSESWEAAARNAVETAAKTIRDLRVAEVTRTDVTVENGKVSGYRVRLSISFKYETHD